MTKGKIVTFYSYKGGTGRSMALANVAWILASNGKRVLVIDWDLEAPGLHRYFRPFLIDPDLVSTEGVIDYVWDLALKAVTPEAGEGDSRQDWTAEAADIARYAVCLDWDDFGAGGIDFIPAGRQGPGYAKRVNSFSWLDFYERMGGGKILQAARGRLRQEYDFVLIDSRTGVSDTSGICTVQMPDVLVACFTPNLQSVEGVAAVLDSVLAQRSRKDLRILPVMMRLELGERERLEAARAMVRAMFGRYLGDLSATDQRGYWADAEVLYHPFYAYGEVLATFGDPAGTRGSENTLLGAMERLTRRVAAAKQIVMKEVDEPRRQKVLASYAYSGVKATVSEVVFEDPALQRLYTSVRERCRSWSQEGRRPALLLDAATLVKMEASSSLGRAVEGERALSEYLAASRRASAYRERAWKALLAPGMALPLFAVVPDRLAEVLGQPGLTGWRGAVAWIAAVVAAAVAGLEWLRVETGVPLADGLRLLLSRPKRERSQP